jgi:methylated-DNA-[protein]-cysteine S-methyltransferase
MAEPHLYTLMESPLGELILTASEGGITGIYLPKQVDDKRIKKNSHNYKRFQPIIKQLDEYFQGVRCQFDLSLELVGTEFQKRVWTALLTIGYGETKSYLDIATLLNQPTASRAVGTAIGKNPVSIIVPCHRVIGSNGSLTGYAGGIEIKKRLLDHETRF